MPPKKVKLFKVHLWKNWAFKKMKFNVVKSFILIMKMKLFN